MGIREILRVENWYKKVDPPRGNVSGLSSFNDKAFVCYVSFSFAASIELWIVKFIFLLYLFLPMNPFFLYCMW